MTQEEKAKSYDEAIERAKKELNTCGSQDCDAARQIFRFFPELKESEDERIRKMLIGIYKKADMGGEIFGEGITYKQVIAWLERQGEQKPNDKAGTKFKIEKGKWYVCIRNLYDNYANKAFCEGDIYLSTQDGSLIPCNSNVTYKVVCPDTYFRDWTIQDAKDGDVLAIGDEYFLFKKKKENSSPVVYISHCFTDSAGAFRVTNGRDCGEFLSIENGIKACPATKKQYELLFQKMHESGYEWNAEKKELKKIGQNPAWSEKDEHYKNGLIGLVENSKAGLPINLKGEAADKCIDWLKSLKDKVVYQKGQQDALKNLPKWKKVDSNPPKVQYNLQGKRLYKNGEYYIELSDLETLPKEE